jgi:hypothetical protein
VYFAASCRFFFFFFLILSSVAAFLVGVREKVADARSSAAAYSNKGYRSLMRNSMLRIIALFDVPVFHSSKSVHFNQVSSSISVWCGSASFPQVLTNQIDGFECTFDVQSNAGVLTQ